MKGGCIRNHQCNVMYPMLQLPSNVKLYFSYAIYISVMYSIQKRYDITLRLGVDLHNITDDEESIFTSFSLPSWLSSTYDTRILTYDTDNGIPFYLTEAKAHALDIGHDIKLIYREVEKDIDMRVIKYEVIDQALGQEVINNITVVFEKSHPKGCLYIRVYDQRGILESVFDDPDVEMFVKKSTLKAGELEYPYIEPMNYRMVEETEREHLHLAFQGGGVKGFAYIGAYKALTEIHENILIKSVIGSSAGSAIALAISSGATTPQLVDTFMQMLNVPKDKPIKSFRDITPEKSYIFNDIKIKIRRALHDYGLIENHLLDLLVEEILHPDVIDKLMEVLCGSNESLREMFSMEVEEVVEEQSACCWRPAIHRKEVKTKLLNYYGLIEGKLLAGKEIEKIATNTLVTFLDKKFNENPERVMKVLNLKDQEFQTRKVKIALHLTMNQFYELTDGIEFTATGVDLNSKVLRFFNHKTTPHLPVTKAVQISGSFPVAFEAMDWKKSWGKYYIHYDTVRKEIDLEGHIFTDGGMLANFPIMYLDNEEMRPMYFSHKKNEKTKIFGFGLEEIPKEEDPGAIQKHEKAMDELTEAIKKRLPYLKFLWTQLVHTPSPEIVKVSSLMPLTEIPIFDLLSKVISTYSEANENFVKECFISRIYILPNYYSFARFVMERQEEKTVLQNLEGLRESLIKIYTKLYQETISIYNIRKSVSSSLKILELRHEFEDILTMKMTMTSNLTEYSLFLSSAIKNESPSSEFCITLKRLETECNNILSELKKVSTLQIFSKAESLETDISSLKWLGRRVIDLFENKGKQFNSHIPRIEKMKEEFFAHIKLQLLNSLETIVGDLESKEESIRTKRETSDNSQSKYTMLHDMNKLYSTFPQQELAEFKEFKSKFDSLNDPFMMQAVNFLAEQNNIKHYVRKMIFKRESNNIHIVFQGKGASTKYYMDIYKMIKEELFMLEKTKWKAICEKIARRIIKANEQSSLGKQFSIEDLVKFLVIKPDLITFVEKNLFSLPSSINLEYVHLEISPEVKSVIDEKVEQFKSNKIHITSITCSNVHAFLGFMIAGGFSEEMIETELVKLRDDFATDATDIEKEFKTNDWMVPFKGKVREFQKAAWDNRFDLFDALEKAVDNKSFNEKDLERIKEEFQKSKEMISDSFVTILNYLVEIQVSSSNDGLDKVIASKMSLITKNQNFIQTNKKMSADTKELINYIFQQFQEQLKMVIFAVSTDHILEFLALESDASKKEAMWKGMIISRFMKSDKYKHHVYTLLGKMNLPKNINLKEFHEICPRKIELNFSAMDITYLKQVFINYNTYPQMPIWAALVTALSFPVLFPEVIAKPGWIEKISKSKDERNLNLFFSYEDEFKSPPIFTSGNVLNSFPLQLLTNTKMQERCFEGRKYTFLSFGIEETKLKNKNTGEFKRKFLGFTDTITLGSRQLANSLPKMAEAGTVLMTKSNILTGFVESHDNLMVEMYFEELLRLPVRIGTLDFYMLGKESSMGIPITQETLEETYFYTLEKFNKKPLTYLKLQLKDKHLKVLFFSKERKSKDLFSKYKVEYKHNIGSPYELLLTDHVKVVNNEHSLFVKIHYVDKESKLIKFTEYKLDFSNIHRSYKRYSGVYPLPYSKILNQSMKPLTVLLRDAKHERSMDNAEEIFCKSIVDITQNGLYCMICCGRLQKKDVQVYEQEKCSSCLKNKMTKFVCRQQGCSGKYCMRCTKSSVIVRTAKNLTCNLNHEFQFLYKYGNSILSDGEGKFVRCDICLKTTDEYYEDAVCEYRICQPCCADFILI